MKTKKLSDAEKRRTLDINSPEGLKLFQEDVRRFTEKATRSREAAIKVLVETGIYTKTGRLTKNYR